ncbi:XrtV sorting system accessory protein [Novosphingobium lentum]|uniref:XrtV sorting system accessory protein n=1 Tax=Novosphingobium lentum TaxID=145287 RepID=UPI0008367D43|nr:XrtV sorting system accessory protein [Novosphingobium lentum]
MKSVFDWLTVAIFIGIALIYLQRSVGDRPAHDAVWKYLPAAGGCMLANYVGNSGMPMVATTMMLAVLIYVWLVIRPLERA